MTTRETSRVQVNRHRVSMLFAGLSIAVLCVLLFAIQFLGATAYANNANSSSSGGAEVFNSGFLRAQDGVITEVASGDCGDDLTWALTSDGKLTISGTGTMTDWTSASNTPWKDNRESIKSVEIPEGVTSIGSYAFSGCTALEAVKVPASVATIGNYAFSGCTALASLEFANNSCLESFGTKAFDKCEALQPVKTTSKVVYAQFKATVGTEDMPVDADSGFIYGYGVGGEGVWLLGLNNTQSWPKVPVTIAGQPVVGIAEGAFSENTAIRGVTFDGTDDGSSKVETIEAKAFYKCTSLEQFRLPVSVASIGESTFEGCKLLVSDPFMEASKLTSIGAKAFKDCTSLASVTVPKSVSALAIGSEAFSGCTSMKKLALTKAVTAIGEKAFDGVDAVSFPEGSSIAEVTYNMFYGCKQVSLGEGTTSIGNRGFSGCSMLTGVDLPESLVSIGNSAFSGCSSLVQVSVPAAVTSIGDSAFNGCSKLSSAVFASGTKLTSIGASAFKGCTALAAFEIPAAITALGDEMFSGCRSLVEITVPANIASIGEKAFFNCAALASVDFATDCHNGSALNALGVSAFEGCTNLDGIVIPASTTTISARAFYGCSSLTNIELPAAISSIGTSAFQNCSSLGLVRILFTDAALGENCFKGIADPSLISVGNETMYSQLVGNKNFVEEYTFIELREGDITYIGLADITVESIIIEGTPTIKVTVVYNGETLKEGTDYELQYEDSTQTGTKAVVVKGLGKYVGFARAYLEGDPSIVASGACGENLGWTIYKSGLLKVKGSGAMTDWDAADKTPWYGWRKSITSVEVSEGATSIGSYAFSECSDILNATMASSVATVGSHAFDGCTKLATADLSASLTSIGEYGFYNCAALESVTLPAALQQIGEYAFNGCRKMSTLEFEAGCKLAFIPDYAFNGCTALKSVEVPAEVESIGVYAFNGCTALESAVISASVASIDDHAFYGCRSLTSLEFADGSWIESIDDAAFKSCSALKSVKTTSKYVYSFFKTGAGVKPMPVDANSGLVYAYSAGGEGIWLLGLNASSDKVDVPLAITNKPIIGIAQGAFAENTAIRTVTFVETSTSKSQVKTIEPKAFFKCTSLEQCQLPASVVSIGESAFEGCKLLSSDSLAQTASLENVGAKAFKDCSSMTSITVSSSAAALEIGTEAFSGCTGAKSLVLPKAVTSIGVKALNGIDAVSFPNGSSIAEITQNMFYGCKQVSLGAGTTSIADSAFNGCSMLEEVVFPDSLTTIGVSAFSGCRNLGDVALPAALASIGDSAFTGCTSMTAVDIAPQSKLASIGAQAFSGCTKLATVALAADTKLASIGASAFKNCPALDGLVIPSTVATIDDEAFSGCKALTALSVPASATSIGAKAFYNCTSLATLDFAADSKLTCIGDSAFEGCKALVGTASGGVFTLPASVETIGAKTFYNCSSLATLAFADNAKISSIGEQAFYGCASIQRIVLPASVSYIGASAFKNCSGLNTVRVLFTDADLREDCFKGIDDPSLVSVSNQAMYTRLKDNRNFFEEYTTIELQEGDPLYIDSAEVTDEQVVVDGVLIWEVAASYGSETLKEGVDYELQFEGSDPATAKSVVLKGIGKYIGYNRHALVPDPSIVASGACGDDLGWFLYNDGQLKLKGSGSMWSWDSAGKAPWYSVRRNIQSVDVPEGVTSIGIYAFSGCTALQSATIAVSVTSIGDRAFDGCTSLQSADLPNALTTIGAYAFNNCSALESVTIPASVEQIGDHAFSGCKNMASLAFAAGSKLETIAANTFNGCAALQSVTVPASVTAIGDNAFAGCSSLDTLAFAEGSQLESIGNRAFEKCAALEAVTIPVSVKVIDGGAFASCASLSTLEFADGSKLETFGNKPFDKCTALQPVKTTSRYVYDYFVKNSVGAEPLPAEAGFRYALNTSGDGVWLLGLTETQSWPKVPITLGGKPIVGIAEGAFAEDTSIRDIVFEETVDSKSQIETIEARAFYKCTSLTQCCLPASVKYVGASAFEGCKLLASSPFVEESQIVSIGARAFYQCESLPSLADTAAVKNSLKATEIGSEAFSGCMSIMRVDLTKAATTIGARAFNGIDTVAFPYGSSLATVTKDMFYGCANVELGEGTMAIGDNGFSNCNMLQSVVIPATVTSIGNSAFSGCSKLAQLILPDNVLNIGNSAFNGCSSLATIVVPNAVTSIGSGAFKGCSKLESITIPSSVTALNSEVFSGCSALTEVIIPANVITIGDKAFYNCAALATVAFADNSQLMSIGASAFEGCRALTSFDVPAPTLVIGDKAFKSCTSLATLTFAENSALATIGNEAFFGCAALEFIELPKDVVGIGASAFKNCSSLNAIGVLFTDAVLGADCFKGIANPSVISVNNGIMFSQLVDNKNFIEDYTTVEFVNGNFYYIGTAAITVDSVAGVDGATETKVTVVFNGTTLKEGEDYEVSIEDAAHAGSRSVVVKGKGNYVGYARQDFRTNLDVPEPATGLIYNGAEQTGVASTNLYTVKNGSATKAGTYKAVVTLADKYNYQWSDGTTEDKTIEWTIDQVKVVVTPNTASKNYSDRDPLLTATVTCAQALVDTSSVRYTLSRERGEDVGSYLITVTGNESQGNFKVEFKTGAFTIKRKNISGASVNTSQLSVVYTGSAICPTVWVSLNGRTLTNGTDYKLTYSNNVDEGKATIVVSGKGNYAGSVKGSFQIVSNGAGLAVGTVAMKKGVKYKVTSADKVKYVKAPKSKKKVVVPASVKLNGKTYKVNAIGAKAFKSCSATYVIVKTKLLKKSTVKKCFTSSKVKKVKVLKSKKKAYKKIFTKKICGKKVTVV